MPEKEGSQIMTLPQCTWLDLWLAKIVSLKWVTIIDQIDDSSPNSHTDSNQEHSPIPFPKSYLENTKMSICLYSAILSLEIGHISWGNFIQKKYWCSLGAGEVQNQRRIQRVMCLDFSTSSYSFSRESFCGKIKATVLFSPFLSRARCKG